MGVQTEKCFQKVLVDYHFVPFTLHSNYHSLFSLFRIRIKLILDQFKLFYRRTFYV